jgi:hypothetical protein
MAETVRIHGKLMHSHGVPWSGALIDVVYRGYSQTATEQRPSDHGTITTNPDGTWETTRWVNARGDYQSHYLFKFPTDQVIKVYLTEQTPADIEFSQLALDSTPPTDPSYPSLIALINTILATSGVSFPAGGTAGQVLGISQASPRVMAWTDAASGGDVFPSGGILGEVLGVTQSSPRGLDWVNFIDGGTFN